MRSQIGVGLLVSCWYRIRSGIGSKIYKTGLDPGSKNQSPHTLMHTSTTALAGAAFFVQRSDSVFLLSDPILFLQNDSRIRSESCFG